MTRPRTSVDMAQLRTQAKERLGRLIALGKDRRGGLVIALLLAVPFVAWAQPLGLLFWARLRLLTDLPRTALATEEAKTVVVVPPVEFPELPDVGFDGDSSRDPLRISPHHFPRANGEHAGTANSAKSDPDGADNPHWRMTRRSYLTSLVEKIRLQALITGKSIAIIDDRTYRVGELLDSEAMEGEQVTLQSVGRNSVIVEVDGFEFEIRLVGGGTGKSVLRGERKE